MDGEALGRLFLRELEKIIDRPEQTAAARIEGIYRLMQLIFAKVTRTERLQFTTFFARIAYAGQQYQLDRQLQYFVHHFRRGALRAETRSPAEQEALADLGNTVLLHLIPAFFPGVTTRHLHDRIATTWPLRGGPVERKAYYPYLRVVIFRIDQENKQVWVRSTDAPETERAVQYDIPERNELFTSDIEQLEQLDLLPITANLLEVEVDAADVLRPRGIVLEPDYLIDVTAIASSFQGHTTAPEVSLLTKMLPFESSLPLLLGHIANFFLDELVHQPDRDFKSLFAEVFRLNPLAFALLDDRTLRELMQRAHIHYTNLRQMAAKGFREAGMEARQGLLEPTFYSNRYGLQGRLDLLFSGTDRTAIVELKSGKVYLPNVYGISQNHFVQTLMYDLLIRSVYGAGSDPENYILYSGLEDRQLRYAPVVKAQQLEALHVRNQLILLEKALLRLGFNRYYGTPDQALEKGRHFFRKLHPDAHPQLKGFIRRDLERFWQTFDTKDRLLQQYFIAFAGFIAREHHLAKIGQVNGGQAGGQAALWLSSRAEKLEQFELLDQLRILENRANASDPVIRFVRTEETADLTNFRRGDIAVLYPAGAPPLDNQLFKCTVIAIDGQEVHVRLRSRQSNLEDFSRYERWNLEHDLLDSAFVGQYRSLYQFLDSAGDKQDLLLTRRPPQMPQGEVVYRNEELTAEQEGIFAQMMAAEEYFLLWGPPGTGKTSIMLKHLVGYLLQNTQEHFVLLAYTNRAVDEICAAIEQLGPWVRRQYLRIGSRYATDSRYTDQLLSVQSEQITTREQLRQLLLERRILVGTLSSVTAKPELLKFKHFDRVVIDEASQILEPNLVGLLTQFPKFLLIGDHRQLPAVVTQAPGLSVVEEEHLRSVGLVDLRNSLFERLYMRCQEAGWEWAYAQLSHQGRMHHDLMTFPNRYFYDGRLKILPRDVAAHRKQLAAIPWRVVDPSCDLQVQLCSSRFLFFSTPSDDAGLNVKTNRYEAQLIVRLIGALRALHESNGDGGDLQRLSLGIITPYRAQIACIRHALREAGMEDERFTIDTVERYQGGARDIILISLCTNSLAQLYALSSLSSEGVDRKLNVALTRARRHLMVLGNPDVLQKDPVYHNLIQFYRHWGEQGGTMPAAGTDESAAEPLG